MGLTTPDHAKMIVVAAKSSRCGEHYRQRLACQLTMRREADAPCHDHPSVAFDRGTVGA